MKKLLTSVSLIILFSISVMSQGIYVRAGGGYGLPVATSSIGDKYMYNYVDNGVTAVGTYSLEGVDGSFGSGVNFNVAVGYKFNENFIFELNTQYLLSKKYKTFNNDNYTYVDYSYVDYDNVTTSAKALFINPSFVFSAGFGKAAPYGRFGVLIGSPKVTGSESTYYNGDGVDSSETKWEYTKGIAFGFQGAIGMDWKINEKFDIYTELNITSITYYAKERNVTKSINTYGDMLPNMAQSQKQTLYKKKFDPYTANNDYNQPTIARREGTPFSSIALQIGIKYNLWTKPE